MASENNLTHIDHDGSARMVDVGAKPESVRVAVSGGHVSMRPETLAAIRAGNIKKGDVLSVARLAGIMAAKRTADLIPLCHPLMLNQIEVELEIDEENSRILIRSTVRTTGKTGVEMEALTATSVAALTIYDMAKAMDREMKIENIRLIEKTGGTRGDYKADE